MKAIKNLLVYADGRVEDAGYELLGAYFIRPVMVDGDMWRREFQIHCAGAMDPTDPEKFSARTMVGIERSFTLSVTGAEMAKRKAESDDATMKRVLWGIANYPGDGK